MKNFFTIAIIGILFYQSQAEDGVNIKSLFKWIESNIQKAESLCASGYAPHFSGDFLKCVVNAIDDGSTTTTAPVPQVSEASLFNIAADCPSTGCPANPSCNPGFHLVTFEENCCCIKDTSFKPVEEPKILTDPDPTAVQEESSSSLPPSSYAPACPSIGCLPNAICPDGSTLITHDDNCCCI